MEHELREDLFFKLLAKCPETQLEKLIHHLVDLFCGQEAVIYEDFSSVWSLEEWWDLISESRKFIPIYYNSFQKGLNLPLLSVECKQILSDCLSVRKSDIKTSLITKTQEISSSFLIDFDWKLKLTLASDKIAQINQPCLHLDLDLAGNSEKGLHLDLSKEELKNLIDSMEKAKKALGEITIPD